MLVKFQRWFNVRPWGAAQRIIDDRGEDFWITWGASSSHGPRLFLHHRGECVGTVESAWNEQGGLDLEDIIIYKPYQHFRQRGLGKRMMQLFIEKAREMRAKSIRGYIRPDEATTEQYLTEWYKRQGFDISEARPGLYHILLELRNEQGGGL